MYKMLIEVLFIIGKTESNPVSINSRIKKKNSATLHKLLLLSNELLLCKMWMNFANRNFSKGSQVLKKIHVSYFIKHLKNQQTNMYGNKSGSFFKRIGND